MLHESIDALLQDEKKYSHADFYSSNKRSERNLSRYEIAAVTC